MKYVKEYLKFETSRCLLCVDAACQKNCPNKIKTDRIIRSLNFENPAGAASFVPKEDLCKDCNKECMAACKRAKIDRAIEIDKIIAAIREGNLNKEKNLSQVDLSIKNKDQVDLSTVFCGVKCENPFFLSSSIVGSNYEMVAKAFRMGWAGVCFKTIGLFTPSEVSPRFGSLKKEANPFLGFKNIEQISDHTIDENIAYISRLKKDFPEKVIIASIMGQTEDEWTTLARMMEKAGADIIELNFSCPQMVGKNLGSDVGTNLDLVKQYTAAAKRGTNLPVLAKMTPNITDMTLPARASIEAGADGIAAINTIKSIMNIDLDNFCSEPKVAGKTSVGGYSGKAVKPIALRFISDMKKDPLLMDIPISGMGGIETWRDAAEFISMGCGTVQITTAVMQYGYRIIEDLISGLSNYMSMNGIENVSSLMGKALDNIVAAGDLDRDTIEYPRFDREKCIGCGRCYISCFDGGHQAIDFSSQSPRLIPDKCAGCQLCALVCPVNAISAGTRVKKKNKEKL